MGGALTITSLPAAALDAAAEFSSVYLPTIKAQLDDGQNLTVLLPPAPYDHADWRRAMVHDLARAYAPARVNFISGIAGESVDATIDYLDSADGVTGQYLETADRG